MPLTRPGQAPPLRAAAIAAGTVTMQFVAGKAVRDALFLTNVGIASLPTMVILSAFFAVGFVTLTSRHLKRSSPGSFVPLLFILSAGMYLALWLLGHAAPRFVAVATYLLVSGAGPMLGSGFWLVATDVFDPRSAKRHFGSLTAAGTVGGLVGGLLAERIAAAAGLGVMLPCLAALNGIGAWQVRRLAQGSGPVQATEPTPFDEGVQAEPASEGLQVLAREPYLRSLALLVLLGTVSAGLLDYLLKSEAAAAIGNPAALLRFFAIYYAAVNVLTFLVQTTASRRTLESLGLAAAVAAPSVALLLGAVAGVMAPGFGTIVAVRGGESTMRGSLFRAGYELFFTPVSAQDKRAAKAWIDVVFDRIGEATSGGLVRLVLAVGASAQSAILFILSAVFAGAALLVTTRLNRGYVKTLEQNLRRRAIDVDLVTDITTRSALFAASATLPRIQDAAGQGSSPGETKPSDIADEVTRDAIVRAVLDLRSRDHERVRQALRASDPLPATLVPHAIKLLAWDAASADAARALTTVADTHVGTLVDALTSSDVEFPIRRRIARLLSSSTSQRAVEGLLLGLNDIRFEVRFQCARSLHAILQRHTGPSIDADRVYQIVQRETQVSRRVWEGRRLLDQADEASTDRDFFLDELVRDRANRSLAHIFTLLSLVLPPVPLRVAFRGLHTQDAHLRGTALEYLEGVLPPTVRESLWPFLDDSREATHADRPKEDVMAELLRSNSSILINLETLRKQLAENEATATQKDTETS